MSAQFTAMLKKARTLLAEMEADALAVEEAKGYLQVVQAGQVLAPSLPGTVKPRLIVQLQATPELKVVGELSH